MVFLQQLKLLILYKKALTVQTTSQNHLLQTPPGEKVGEQEQKGQLEV